MPGLTAARHGYSDLDRPSGPLIWFHGASVGESLACLQLAERIVTDGLAAVLVTSGTREGMAMVKARARFPILQEFVPLDTPRGVARFVRHWHPDVGVFVDSEIWPNLILEARRWNTRLALVDARLSSRSFENWRRFPVTSRKLFSAFDACVTVDALQGEQFTALGCNGVVVGGNLKADAPPLDVDQSELEAMRAAIAGRPVFLAAQTHSGEEKYVLAAHDRLRAEYPNLLTIIVPRNIGRAPDLLQASGHRRTRLRSRCELPGEDTEIYIADTMNELGLFYRLVPFAFLGGTLVPIGGHNPFEPAQLGCGIIAGPHVHNMLAAYTALFDAQGIGRLNAGAELSTVVASMMAKEASGGRIGAAAADAAAKLKGATARSASAILGLLAARQRDEQVYEVSGAREAHTKATAPARYRPKPVP